MGADQCREGFACTGGYCEPMCSTASDCAPNWACLPQANGGTLLGYSACDAHCNPVDAYASNPTHQACNANQRCDPLSGAAHATVCSEPAGAGTQGTPCSADTDCMANYGCVTPAGQSPECEQYCQVGQSDCAAGDCVSFASPELDGAQENGVCE